MDNSTYYQKNREISKRAKDYYYNNVEAIRKIIREINVKVFQKKREKIKSYQKNYREKMKTLFQKKKGRK